MPQKWFDLKGYTVGFHSQTKRLEPRYTSEDLAVGMKGLKVKEVIVINFKVTLQRTHQNHVLWVWFEFIFTLKCTSCIVSQTLFCHPVMVVVLD